MFVVCCCFASVLFSLCYPYSFLPHSCLGDYFCAIYFISFPANGDYSFISNTPIPVLFDLSPSLFMDDHLAFIALLSVWLSVRLRCTCLGGAGVQTRDEVSTDGTLALETRNVSYILIIARKRSCGKVMFSKAFVCSRGVGVHA